MVAVRKRPLNKKEMSKGDMDIVDVSNPNAAVIVKETRFYFKYIYYFLSYIIYEINIKIRTKVDLTKYIEEH